MKWIDEIAYGCAAAWSGRYCVTVSVGNIHFHCPILVGDLVELHARVVTTGRTSMHIHVTVQAGDPKSGESRQTTDCMVVMVAVDENSHPVSVPALVPQTDEQKRLAQYTTDVKRALDVIVQLKPEQVTEGPIRVPGSHGLGQGCDPPCRASTPTLRTVGFRRRTVQAPQP